MANAFSTRKGKPFTATDFMPQWGNSSRRRETVEERAARIHGILSGFAQQHNARQKE